MAAYETDVETHKAVGRLYLVTLVYSTSIVLTASRTCDDVRGIKLLVNRHCTVNWNIT